MGITSAEKATDDGLYIVIIPRSVDVVSGFK
jgi:hypothetical protein